MTHVEAATVPAVKIPVAACIDTDATMVYVMVLLVVAVIALLIPYTKAT